MRGLILCEGNADRILVSYYLGKILGFQFSSQDLFVTSSSVLGQSDPRSIFNEKNHSSYVNSRGDNLMIAEVQGFDFVPSIKEFLEWNTAHRCHDCFDKLIIITDNDDASVSKRLEKTLEVIISEHAHEDTYQANQWYTFEYTDGFSEKNTYSFLFLLQPMDGRGNIETFTMDALSRASILDSDVVEKARQYIASIDKDNGVYLTERGDRSKAELSAYFSVVAPKRTFDPINKLLAEVEWQDYDQYNRQFALLRQLV